MSKENFFVGIKNPVNTRRLLLNSSKDILDALKDYENFENFKQEKAKYIVELKRILDEVLVLNKKLKKHMPKTPLKSPKRKAAGKKAKKSKMPEVTSKIEELESELSMIEGRLKALE